VRRCNRNLSSSGPTRVAPNAACNSCARVQSAARAAAPPLSAYALRGRATRAAFPSLRRRNKRSRRPELFAAARPRNDLPATRRATFAVTTPPRTATRAQPHPPHL
jgi:hypothetical protein